MKNKFYLFSSWLLIAVFVLGVMAVVPASSEAGQPAARKIVVFEPWLVNQAAKDKLVERASGVKIKNLDLIGGMAVYLPNKAAEKALANQSGVLRIDDDIIVEALAKGGKGGGSGKPAPAPQPSQDTPWGIDRIDADLAWGVTTGDPIKVAVIDTGIDLTHPDLAQNTKGGYNAINPTKSANDDNGHGTHVAGIIGALNNEIGVIGVGPAIDLYAVKVLDRRGSGWLSDIIEGLDWAIQNGTQVVNMSFGTASDIESFRDAVKIVNAAGIVQVAAAGNNGGSVIYPAAYPEVIAVSAMDSHSPSASWA